MPGKLKTIFSVIKGFRRHSIIILLFMVSSALFESFSVGLIAPLIQSLVSGTVNEKNFFYQVNRFFSKNPISLEVLLVEIFLFLLLSEILNYCRCVYGRYFEEKLKKFWRVKIYSNYIRCPYNFFVAKRHGEIVNNVINETETAISGMDIAMELTASLLISSFFISVLFITSPRVSIVIGVVCALVFLIVKKLLFEYSERIGRDRIKISQDLNSQVAESINGILQVKLFNLENSRIKKFLASSRIYAWMRTVYVAFRMLTLSGLKVLLFGGGIAVILLNTKFHFFDFRTVLPVASTFLVISARLFDVTSNIMGHQMNFINCYPALELIDTLLQSKQITAGNPLESKKISAPIKVNFDREIELKNIQFAYDNKKILSNLTVSIPCNKKVGIVGLSGSGKTTLIYLLLGIYAPGSGDIRFDDVSIYDIDIAYLRNNIGVVTQDNFIFNGTIRENIAIGLENVNEQQIIEAAKKANAHEFIAHLKDGYDTFIGEKGLKLSGGQRQRLVIARGILRNPKVYIFDEATNELDKESEGLVMETINNLARESTVIIISHDFTLVNDCDKIIFLKDGAVSEEGTHRRLLDNKKEYWKLYSELTTRI